jgi:hypothetical protein
MKNLLPLLALPLLLLTGCNKEPPPSYRGSIEVQRTDGKVSRIEMSFPVNKAAFHNKQDASRAIDNMEGVLKDLKAARDQMDE